MMINRGWECPKCGAVMSPSSPTCWYCKPFLAANVEKPICKHHAVLKFGCAECDPISTQILLGMSEEIIKVCRKHNAVLYEKK